MKAEKPCDYCNVPIQTQPLTKRRYKTVQFYSDADKPRRNKTIKVTYF